MQHDAWRCTRGQLLFKVSEMFCDHVFVFSITNRMHGDAPDVNFCSRCLKCSVNKYLSFCFCSIFVKTMICSDFIRLKTLNCLLHLYLPFYALYSVADQGLSKKDSFTCISKVLWLFKFYR